MAIMTCLLVGSTKLDKQFISLVFDLRSTIPVRCWIEGSRRGKYSDFKTRPIAIDTRMLSRG